MKDGPPIMLLSGPNGRTLGRAAWALLLLITGTLAAQQPPEPQFQLDTDHDGLSDTLEQQLLTQFAPSFMVGAHDCSVRPASFQADVMTPEVLADDGTIYGQVFPHPDPDDGALLAELHFYHLWRRDCGGHGHPLDTEHVAVLVRASDTHLASATWKALYWYAGAHEDTVCDVSQVARASTLQAESHGASVWISPGKHASYLNATLCQRGCGADRCELMVPLRTKRIVNLGEVNHPMNGSLFIAAPAWPLEAKMEATNFPAAPLARLNQLPATDIAWFHPGRHPAQGIIAHSSSTEQVLANGSRDTTAAISLADDRTTGALSTAGTATGSSLATAGESAGGGLGNAGRSTGKAVENSFSHTRRALGTSTQHLGRALHLTPKADTPAPATPPQ